MNCPVEQIIGSEKLTSIFGHWPSFHDGYVDLVRFEPNSKQRSLEIECRIFETTNRLDERGFYIHEKHTKTKLRFIECDRVSIKAIYAGVIIFSLEIEPAILEFSKKSGWAVSLDSSTDFEMKLQCSAIEVLEAIPDLQQS
jgi:hypothetical protein